MEEELPWYKVPPDFNQSLWISIEDRINRKLTSEENKRIYYLSGMRKEWLFNLAKTYTPDQIEQLILTCHLSYLGEVPSLWKQIINWICR